jgi:hypothetical protein
MCEHHPPCPDALAPDNTAARVRVSHPEQGWSLLCNGVVLFDDAGGLLPDGREVGPRPVVPNRRPQFLAVPAPATRVLAEAA